MLYGIQIKEDEMATSIDDFVSKFKNHPVLFIGAGFSLRYLSNSFSWDELLKKTSNFISSRGDEEYLDLKSKARSIEDGAYDFAKMAQEIDDKFTKHLEMHRNGDYESINSDFYEGVRNQKQPTRMKLYLSSLLKNSEYRSGVESEIKTLKEARKNIGSIITTNYDQLIEEIFASFKPVIGNDLLLSEPYGTIYKIHGCVSAPEKMIITKQDYEQFDRRYELIRAQLLSLFIHNPIIFIGYSVTDPNIKSILNTIFSYVQPNSEQAKRISSNFLLVEYSEGESNCDVVEHDIQVSNHLSTTSTIRINKVKTDNFIAVYQALANLHVHVSAMDVRKVMSVVKEIKSGGSIKVQITDDINDLANDDKILAIGSKSNITYQHTDAKGLIKDYFDLITEKNTQQIDLINEITISAGQYFPVFGFGLICPQLTDLAKLKKQQIKKLKEYKINNKTSIIKKSTITDVLSDSKIPTSNKVKTIFMNVCNKHIQMSDLMAYLEDEQRKNAADTDYRRFLSLWDFFTHGSPTEIKSF